MRRVLTPGNELFRYQVKRFLGYTSGISDRKSPARRARDAHLWRKLADHEGNYFPESKADVWAVGFPFWARIYGYVALIACRFGAIGFV
jgi:hypothetical protein